MLKRKIFTYIIIIVISIPLYFCKESVTNPAKPNLAPNTELFLYPDSTISEQKSKLRVHWWGDDPDGLVAGFFFKWVGLDSTWHFTTKNDSTFSLPIGSSNALYTFMISAADNSGNGKYDPEIIENNINYGPEPFEDKNGNGKHDKGEPFIDIGLIDPTPATQIFPIKNSAPKIQWSKETILPKTSFPVMTVGWNASDLDGNSTITKINVALNDTTKGIVSLPGAVRLITLRSINWNDANPEFEILINGSESNIFSSKLGNLKLDNDNVLYIQAVDISNAKSKFTPLPDTGSTWYIKKPKGKLLIVDDYALHDEVQSFYNNIFNSLNNGSLVNKYDILDLEQSTLPYRYITFLETLHLFDYVFWYSNSSPSLDLANLATQKYIQGGGHIAFSMTFEDSSSNFQFDLSTLQNFLPIDSLGEKSPVSFLFPGANVLPSNQNDNYPKLKTSSTIGFVRTFYPNSITAKPVYDISSRQINGNIAIINNTKNLFFIGLPLNACNAINGSVQKLLEKIFFDEFGLTQ